MAGGGKVDHIAAEFGFHFIGRDGRVTGPAQSKARRTCQKLLSSHGPDHLRLVLGLLNTSANRKSGGFWTRTHITPVSWLLLNRKDLVDRSDFVSLFDMIDMAGLMASAKKTDPRAPTRTMTVLLAYEMDRLTKAKG